MYPLSSKNGKLSSFGEFFLVENVKLIIFQSSQITVTGIMSVPESFILCAGYIHKTLEEACGTKIKIEFCSSVILE